MRYDCNRGGFIGNLDDDLEISRRRVLLCGKFDVRGVFGLIEPNSVSRR